jgi:hypothetical protein
MSDCCSSKPDSACAVPQALGEICPACGKKGKAVATLTVKSLVRDHTRVPAQAAFSYCRSANCDVVYFSSEAIFRKPDIKVPVAAKENDDGAPLCYCFDYTRQDVLREIQATGTTKIAEAVKAEVQGGFCACEVKNPSGNCCLGAITRAIQQAKHVTA